MKNHIDEVLYSISPDTIVGRRYNPILGIVITLAAAAAMFGDMFQYLMMGGFLVLATGATMICYWLFGDSVHPYYKPTNERLVRTDMIFNVADINRVETLVAAGDFKTLESLPRGTASGLIVVVYATKSGKFAMTQTLEYVPHEYQPVSEPHLFEEGKFTVADFM